MLKIGKYSLGIGDRFTRQAVPQLKACVKAAEQGVTIIPVWNKSNREHLTIGSDPGTTRAAVDTAVKSLGWRHGFHVDADHIRRDTVDRFLPHSDYFTIDVADWIGKPPGNDSIEQFVNRHPELRERLEIPGLDQSIELTADRIRAIAKKYLLAIQEAGKTYRHIATAKGEGGFITEVSMDETDSPQTPIELLVILVAIADEGIPAQTIAPKFTGRFNKGVDYQGDIAQFEKEFSEDLAVIAFAAVRYGLPDTLKLSIHSGSDKFSIYAPVRRCLAKTGSGVHLKTAGTTWLEEMIGLAEQGGVGLEVAKEIYQQAFEHLEELCLPYASVIEIRKQKLPFPEVVMKWDGKRFAGALRHDPKNPEFNSDLRQLVHVGYKMAAKMGNRYLGALETCKDSVGRNVTENLYERHIVPLFLRSGK